VTGLKGKSWRKFRESRRYSTALTAPITYGPSLKTLGWLTQHREDREILIPTAAASRALEAFEDRIKRHLNHPAFSRFGSVTVTQREVRRWAKAWALDAVTRDEMQVMADMLLGSGAPQARRQGCELMLAAVTYAKTADVARIRRTMAGPPSNFRPPTDLATAFEAWRRIQVRQLFRLCLESLLYWTMWQLTSGPRSTNSLVKAFLHQVSRRQSRTAREWLNTAENTAIGPTGLMDQISKAFELQSQTSLARAIADGVSFTLEEAPERGQPFERSDRLPLFRARQEAEAWSSYPTRDFLRHILESWVLAQHVYWSVGRGLADARARGKTLLRLKVVLEEKGWTLAPGATLGRPPVPTRDRLETALTLAKECGLLREGGAR
jgi:hypothetical protein